MSEDGAGLSGVDVACIVGYFIGLGAVSVFAARDGGAPAPAATANYPSSRAAQVSINSSSADPDRAPSAAAAASSSTDTERYFLAGRSMPWFVVGCSLFASNIGSEHFVGLAGTAAASGIAVGFFEWGSLPPLLLLGWVFLPVYLASRLVTVPEYLERRYCARCRAAVVWVSLVLYVLTKIAATLYAGQLVISAVVPSVNGWAAVCVLIGATALYTSVGGLKAVVYTEVLQTLVLVGGGGALLGVALHEVGGLHALREAWAAPPIASPLAFTLLRPASDADFPWPGFALGYFVISCWYWACDQVIVQRALSARGVAAGRAGCLLAAALKLLPPFIMVLPGMCARVLMQRAGTFDAPGGGVLPEGGAARKKLYARSLSLAALLAISPSSAACS
jgi:solute:Na+ symporter, SSS family